MRLAIVNWTGRKVGGIETYLDAVIRGLTERGADVALWHEVAGPQDRESIFVPDGSSKWCAEEIGPEVALQRLGAWQPDLVYAHGLLDSKLDALIPSVAPSVFFLHQYHGTCIGGPKTWKFPKVVPCARRFGWPCLLHYYPHRCGGLNPGTMLSEYLQQSRRLDALRDYRAIVTHTEHMRREYLRHRFDKDRLFKIPFPVAGSVLSTPPSFTENNHKRSLSKLLFLGRMDRLKGGDVLIDAAAEAATRLARPLQLTFAGDGPQRVEWANKAKRILETRRDVTSSFTGWVSAADRDRLYAEADLLVVPSLWPEPFGMVGIEAGRFGVPSAAFAVGGIPEWLKDGKNGHIAQGDPPTVKGLAQAIVRCLENSGYHENLRTGAWEESQAYSTSAHLDALLEVFSIAANKGPQE